MREYQVQGLNWMCGLHYNGINGILADEMVRSASSEASFPHVTPGANQLSLDDRVSARRCRRSPSLATLNSSVASTVRI